MSDILFPRSAQQCVHHRVSEHIRVGMAQQAPFVRNVHPAQNEFPPRDQAVYVIAMTDPHLRTPLAASSASLSDRSSGVVILIFS